jgi:hypothetical protein
MGEGSVMKATVGGIFSGTFDFLRANWLLMIGMLVVSCILLGGLGYLMVGSFFTQAMSGVQPDPAAMLAMIGQFLLFYLVMLVLMYGVSLSVWRHGLTNGQDPVTSNIGWALLGGVTLTLLYIGLMIAIYIVVTIVMLILLMVVGGGASMFGPGAFSPDNLAGPAVAVMVILYIAILVASLWLWARLSVMGPVMAAARTVNPFTGLVQSWRLTGPSQWTIVGFLLLTIVAMVVLFFVAGLIAAAMPVPWLLLLLYVPVLLFWWAAPAGIHAQVASVDRASVFE